MLLIGFWIVAFTLFVFFALIVLVGAPYVPTKRSELERIFKQLKVRKGSQVIDLGSGDGRVLVMASKLGYTAIGYELNPILAFIAKFRLREFRQSKCLIRDYWQADVARANLVFIFSAQPYMKRLNQKLNNELKPGAQVVSYGFSLPGRKIVKKIGAANVYQF